MCYNCTSTKDGFLERRHDAGLLFACFDRVGPKLSKSNDIYGPTFCFSKRKCGFEQRCRSLSRLDLVHGMGGLGQLSRSEFSCRRPFKCTCALKLSLTPSLCNFRSCMSSWHVLCICREKVFLHSMRFFQILPSSELISVAPLYHHL